MSSWDTNYWDFKPPRVHAPEPKARAPKPFPEPDRLFQVQRNSLKVLNDLAEVQRHIGHHTNHHLAAALQRLQTDAENTYRVIRSYLAKYADTQGEL